MIKVQDFTKEYILMKSNNLIEQPMISIILCFMELLDCTEIRNILETILNQTYDNFELILIDDYENDTLFNNIMKSYVEKYNKIIYIKNAFKSNLISLRINQGLSFARGKYVNYQFVGSYITKDYIESMLCAIEKQNKECLVYGKCEFRLNDSKDTYILGRDFNYTDFIYYNDIIPNNSIIHHLSIVNKYGLMDCSVMLEETFFWDFLLRISSKVKMVYLDKVISKADNFKLEYNNMNLDSFDLRVFRNMQYMKREKLILENINEYVVDDMTLIKGEKFINQIFLKYLVKWYKSIKFNYLENNKEIRENLLVVKDTFDSSLDVMFTNFIKILNDKYNMIYSPASQLNDEFIDNVDVVIFHRTYDFASNYFFNKFKKSNIPVSYWIDDDLLNFYKLKDEYNDLPSNLASQKKFELSTPGTSVYKELEHQIKNADVVISYSPQISDSIKNYNDKIIELKLTVMRDYIERKISKNFAVFKIAFIGTDSRRAEIKFFWEDLLHISNKYKNRVEFYFWGYIPEEIKDINQSKVNTENFTTSYYEYMNRLGKQNFDIVVSPLFNVEPKLAKGLTKYIEAAVCGAIGVYSNVKPYKTIEDNINGFKFENTKGELSKKIEKIIEMDSYEREIIFENAKRDIIENYSTESQVYKFKSTIEAIKLHKSLKNHGSICFVLKDPLKSNELKFLDYILYGKKCNLNITVCILNSNNNKFQAINEVCVLNGIEVNYINEENTNNINTDFIDIALKKNIRLFHSYNLIPLVEEVASELDIVNICTIYESVNVKVNYKKLQHIPRYIVSNSLELLSLFISKWDVYSKLINQYDESIDDRNNFYKSMYEIFNFYNDAIKDFNNKEYILKNDEILWNRIYENISKRLSIDDYLLFRRFFTGIKGQIKDLLYNSQSTEVLKYIIWGAGSAGRIAKMIIDEAFPNFKLIGFVDKYKTGEFEGYKIYNLENIEKINFDYAFIATSPGRVEAEKSLSLLKVSNPIEYIILFS